VLVEDEVTNISSNELILFFVASLDTSTSLDDSILAIALSAFLSERYFEKCKMNYNYKIINNNIIKITKIKINHKFIN
jgi:hypothetical protein